MPQTLPEERRQKLKKPILAAILGGIFGPLSTIYFGWKVFLTTLLVVFTSVCLVTWAIPYAFPKWFFFVNNCFFAFWNYMLALAFNSSAENKEEPISLAGLNLVGMEGWYIRFLATSMGLYSGIMLVKDDCYLAAAGVVFLLVPLMIWLFESITAMLLSMLLIALERRSEKGSY